jgi:branched-chain amino acid transport system substrate-binding protein
LSGISRSLFFVCALALASSCTLTRTSVDKCSTNGDCRSAFGGGSICGGDGFCTRAPPNPRCTETFPGDVLTRPENYPGIILYGYEVLRGIETQQARENAVKLAATQVNEEGGLDGHLFGIVFCDVAEDAKYDSLKRADAALADGRYLADVLGVRAIIGPSASPDVLAVFDSLKSTNADVLVISPSATSPALTADDVTQTPTDDRPGLLWRTAVSDVVQGTAIARQLATEQPPVTKVTMIFEKGAYGEGLGGVFTTAFQANGGTVRPLPFTAGVTSERDAAIVDAPTGSPQYVLFISSLSSDGIAFLNAVNANPAAYASTKIFLTDSAANADLLTNAAGASAVFPRVLGSRPSIAQGPVHDLFRTSYTAAYKEDPDGFTFVPHAYDATWLVFYGTAFALRHDHALTGTGIARGLRKIASTGEEVPVAPANWKRISDAIGAGNPVNLAGASGSLDYDPKTEETTGLIDIWKISADGKSIETVTTIDPR